MSDKIKNILIVVLVCIIAVLCFVFAFMLGIKYTDKDNESINEPNTENTGENNSQESIEFVGDKNIEVSYNPSYAASYNLNYKINENGQLVFTDMNNTNNSKVYSSIEGNCKYVTIAIPKGKIEPLYYIAVITQQGKVYFKQIYAYADSANEQYTNGYGSMDDNFVEIKNLSGNQFNGICVKKKADLGNVISDFETITISDIDGKKYYISIDRLKNIELKEFN